MSTLLSRVLITLCLAVAGLLAWFYVQDRPPPAPPAVLEPAPPPPDFAPDIRYPVPEPVISSAAVQAEPPAPLPALADSDVPVTDGLAGVISAEEAARWLVPGNFVRQVVLAVDSLAGRPALKPEARPVAPAPGAFAAAGGAEGAGEDETWVLDPANYARYAPLVRLLDATDMRRVAAVYLRYYPLFQQAWEEIGSPDSYFNDRLVAVIDNLLAAPELDQPPVLVQPRVYFEYADPALEARSSGQKLLVRMGPDNARVIKRKLRELRAAVIGQAAP
jgi:hypothetical protein